MMKKVFAAMMCLSFIGFAAFGDEQEIDFLLFAPDSSNRFVNQEQEMIHLDNLAKYLLDRNLIPGQIHVHGYAATVKNDIDPMGLSRDRALFVISELQRRGVPYYLFAEPTAHGEVDFWGSNLAEVGRNPNRRIRIMLDDHYLPASAFIAADEPRSGFPWLLLLLLILAAALLFLLLHKKRGNAEAQAAAQAAAQTVMANSALPAATAVPASEAFVNLEEEIRRRAYEFYLARNGQDGDAKGDWYKAVPEICAQNEADGYQVYTEDGCWWAHRWYNASGSCQRPDAGSDCL